MYIIYPQQNNQLAIIFPCGDIESSIKDVPEGVDYKIINYLNVDDDFYEAYEFDNAIGIKTNIEKAKKIHLERFRYYRKPILEKLDVEFMRAVETADTEMQKQISIKKQQLRDITTMELPNTLETIKATWPEILGSSPFIDK